MLFNLHTFRLGHIDLERSHISNIALCDTTYLVSSNLCRHGGIYADGNKG